MSAGGNAVDAAIAAIATQGVVAPETCGIGGDLFALVHYPGWSEPKALNSSGRAGSHADPGQVRAMGHQTIPRDHPMAVTVPGCVAGMEALNRALGSMSLADCLAPAIEHATVGFEASAEQARAFSATAELYRHNPAVAGFYPDGEPVAQGMHVQRPELARTLSSIASDGSSSFYTGTPARDIVESLGGVITLDDLAAPIAEWVEPIGAEVAGLNAWTIPPNSQGYLGPATLAVFEMIDPPDHPESPDWWHLLIEAYRCVAWERDDLVADPNHAPLPPTKLLEHERLQRAAATIDRERAGVWPHQEVGPDSTAYLCSVDDSGLSVSVIQSNYNGTGSAFGAAHSGFLLQDRARGFTLTPGHPNEMRPGKRPLHTLSPTIWTAGKETRWVLGTRGGGVQPQLIAQMAARVMMAGQPLDSAQEAPRWTVQEFGPFAHPNLSTEPGVPEPIVSALRKKGHEVKVLANRQPGWGPISIIGVDGDDRQTARDPRVDTTKAAIIAGRL
ncbi:MAG: gamma-glutamyltransferase [Acidimicrobiia bacterium]